MVPPLARSRRGRRSLGCAGAALAGLLALVWVAPAAAGGAGTPAGGASLRDGVSSVAWAIGILDPHVDLAELRGSGGQGSTGQSLVVPATGAPAPPKTAPKQAPKHTVAAPKTAPGELPPASAGSNGTSFARTTHHVGLASRGAFDYGSQTGGPTTTLLGGIALAPPSAPPAIQAAVDAANSISTTPYVWGGGHASFNARGYDCSGAVSFALHGAGFLSQPLASGALMHWGVPGPGKWLTVYASPSHAYAVIAGLRWDTVGDARGTGPRWHPEGPYPTGFAVRHFPGY